MPRTTQAPGPTIDALDLDLDRAATLLQTTRPLSTTAAAFLAVQLFGNLSEEIVGNTATIADPQVGALVGALAPGSPLYYYLPWAPLGVALTAILAVRLSRLDAPTWVLRRVRGALAALVIAIAAKIVLITTINPRFRDPNSTVQAIRGWAITWAFGNGIAILAVAAALALLLLWRARILNITKR